MPMDFHSISECRIACKNFGTLEFPPACGNPHVIFVASCVADVEQNAMNAHILASRMLLSITKSSHSAIQTYMPGENVRNHAF